MAEQPGIEAMRRRIERASRQAPPPRRPAGEGGVLATAPEPAPAPEPEREPAAVPAAAPAARARRSARHGAEPERLEADAPPVNLAIRVRRPLDDRLAEVIHGLRREGVRTSKVELIEMLLWEMPAAADEELRGRLARFREWAPRGAGAPLR